TFTVPGNVGFSIPMDINPDGAITGRYSDPTYNHFAGFLRTPDGNFTKFLIGYETLPVAINPSEIIVGSYTELVVGFPSHGFLRHEDGSIESFDVPGASGTTPAAINPAGTV